MQKNKRKPIPLRTVVKLYSVLCQLPPFSEWGMPAPNLVVFSYTSDRSVYGLYLRPNDCLKHEISVNPKNTLPDTVAVLCHEMVHLKIELMGRRARLSPSHGVYFKRLARQVCAQLGFSMKGF